MWATLVTAIVTAAINAVVKNIPTFYAYWQAWSAKRKRNQQAEQHLQADKDAIKKAIDEAKNS